MNSQLLCKLSDYKPTYALETEPGILLFEFYGPLIRFETCIKAAVEVALRMLISQSNEEKRDLLFF